MAQSSEDSADSHTAQYIEGMAKELRIMAAKADMGFLAYLLSMVEQKRGARPNRTICFSGTPAFDFQPWLVSDTRPPP
ncbi:MAG TPA: hypothetical protein VII91_06215 [Bauldia sp.]